jgi:hypothetical protein
MSAMLLITTKNLCSAAASHVKSERAVQQKSDLFDHFVYANQQAIRERQANVVCGALVDDQFETGGLLDR